MKRRYGYHIWLKNWRSPIGELDLVLLDHKTVTIIEVKTRRYSTKKDYSASEAVNKVKTERLHLLGKYFSLSYRRTLQRLGVTAIKYKIVAVYYEKNRWGFLVPRVRELISLDQ